MHGNYRELTQAEQQDFHKNLTFYLATITDDVNLVNITQGSIRAIVKGPLPALKKVEVALDSGKFTTSNLTFFLLP